MQYSSAVLSVCNAQDPTASLPSILE